MTVALMYHGLYTDESDLARIDLEDQPYAVSKAEFAAQLQVLKSVKTGVAGTEMPDVIVTFDDGHVSNYEIALPMLADAGIQAYFFITTDFIQGRPHFCQPRQLREMHEAGMIIGSHGKTHRFFADLEDCEAVLEFDESRTAIESFIEGPVESISFPGGRYLEQARRAGYHEIYGSGFGVINGFPAKSGESGTLEKALERIAIRKTTDIETFSKIVHRDSAYYRRESAKVRAKELMKRILGNQRYHALYKYAIDR